MSRKDFDIPDFGPAEIDERPSSGRQSAKSKAVRSPAPAKSSGGWLTGFFILLLITASCGLGYFTYALHFQLQTAKKGVATLEEQVAVLQKALSLAESEVQNSGSSIQGQISNLNKQIQTKNRQLDSEIAKLWTTSYQRNRPAIAEQGELVKANQEALVDLDKKLGAISGGISSLYERIDSVAVELNDSQAAEVKKVRGEILSLQTSVALAEEAINDANAQLLSQQRELVDRVSALELATDTSKLERRIRTNEAAVKSIDAMRREVNSSLIQLKSRVNSLQFSVEKLSN